MSQVNYRIRSGISQTQLQLDLFPGGKDQNIEALKQLCVALGSGNASAVVETATGSAAATGTVTIASNAAQTVVINGVTLTGGTDYVIATLTAAQVAANLAAAINASVNGYVQLVEAFANAAIVTLVAKSNGVVGNLYTTTATGAASAQQAVLAGGTVGTVIVMPFNKAVL